MNTTSIPPLPPPDDADHGWVHEHLATAVTGGLSASEQARFDSHVHNCPACFDAFTEARDADRMLLRAMDSLTPTDGFEERLVTAFREKEMESHLHPMAKRAGLAIAAAVALAATGVSAQYLIRGDLLNNPLSQRLVAQSDGMGPGWKSPIGQIDNFFERRSEQAALATPAPADELTKQVTSVLKKRVDTPTITPFHVNMSPQRTVAQVPYRASLTSPGGQDASVKPLEELPRQSASRRDGNGVIALGGVNAYGGETNVNASTGGFAGQLADRKESLELYYQPDVIQRLGVNQAGASSGNLFGGGADKKTTEKESLGNAPVVHAMLAAGNAPVLDGPAPAAASATTTPSDAPTSMVAEVAERRVIRNGQVEFEVRSFEDAYGTISTVVGEEGGFVSSTSSDKLANGKIRGSIVVRVSPEHLDRLLLKLRALGELKSQQISANDVTKEYTDLDSELRALRAMEGRLIDIIKTGKGEVKDLVVAEKQLGEYRVRIEKIEGEIRYYNNLIAMATLTITAYEKDIQTPTAAQEQENVAMSIEAEDVEGKYAEARKILEDAKGRIVESELKKHDAGEYAAQIVADVPPEKADFVAAQLKQVGKVAGYNRDRKQTTTGGSGAPSVRVEEKPTRFTISLYNLANIAPRETAVLTIAVRDVEEAHRKVLELIRKPMEGDKGGQSTGKVVTSNLTGQQVEQMVSEVHADVKAEQAEEVLRELRAMGEVMTSSLAENPDTANVTSAKEGIQLRIVNVAAVTARESRVLTMVAQDVPTAYGKLVGALQELAGAGNAHVLSSQLNQSDPRTVNAALAFDVRRESLAAIEKAFAEAGIDTLGRNITRSTDTANTLDSKVHFQIDELKSAEALPPRRTQVVGREIEDVEKGMESLQGALEKGGVKHAEYSWSKEASGTVMGHLVVEVPMTEAMAVLGDIRGLGGVEKVNQVVEDNQVPETRFARERIDVTLTSREPLVGSDKGLGKTVWAALGSATAALLWSVYLILTGVLFVGPWVVIAWVGWRVMHRRKGAG